MVVRVEGKVDGKNVIFLKSQGDVWETTVPRDIDGTYIVEVTAYDDAGNIGFVTKVLLTISIDDMCIRIEPFPWESELLSDDFEANLIKEKCGR